MDRLTAQLEARALRQLMAAAPAPGGEPDSASGEQPGDGRWSPHGRARASVAGERGPVSRLRASLEGAAHDVAGAHARLAEAERGAYPGELDGGNSVSQLAGHGRDTAQANGEAQEGLTHEQAAGRAAALQVRMQLTSDRSAGLVCSPQR